VHATNTTLCFLSSALSLAVESGADINSTKQNAEAAGTMKEKPTRSIKPRRITLQPGARSP